MISLADVRVVIGDRWRSDTRTLLEQCGHHFDARPLDFNQLRAPVDLVVRGDNLTGTLPDEPVVTFVQRLSTGIGDLRAGTAGKVLVDFEESPWEIAITRDDDDCRLSVYEVVAPGEIRADQIVLQLDDLTRAVLDAVDDMSRATDSLPPTPNIAALGEILQDCRRRLRKTLRPPWTATIEPPVAPPSVDIFTRCSAGFAFTTTLRPAGSAIMEYVGEHALDRHALLVGGDLMLAASSARALRCNGRPLMLLEQAIDQVEEMLERDDANLELNVFDRRLVLDGRKAVFLHPGGHASSLELGWLDFATALADHCVDVVDACGALNPLLRVNECLDELRQRALGLRRTAVRRLDPAYSGVSARPSALPRAEGSPNELADPEFDLRMSNHEVSWTRTFSRGTAVLDYVPGSDVIVAYGPDGCAEVSVRDGDVRADLPVSGASVLAYADTLALFALDSAGLVIATSADERAERLTPRPIEPTQLLRVADRLIVAERDGRVHSWVLGDFDHAWTSSLRMHPAHALGRESEVVFADADGDLVCIAAHDGVVRWRRHVDAEILSLIGVGDRVACICAHPRTDETSIRMVDSSGEWAANERFVGSVVRLRRSRDGQTALVLEGHGIVTLLVLTGSGEIRSRKVFRAGRGNELLVRDVLATPNSLFVAGPRGVALYRAGANEASVHWATPLPDGRALPADVHLAISGDILAVGSDTLHLFDTSSGRALGQLPGIWERLVALHSTGHGGFVAVDDRRDAGVTLIGVERRGFLGVVR